MKNVSASVGFIINFMASRSCVARKLNRLVPKLPRKAEKYKISSYLSCKFSTDDLKLDSGGVEMFSGSTLVTIRPYKDNVMFLMFCSDKKKMDS